MLKLIHLEAVNMLAFNRDAAIGRLNAVQRGDFTVSIAGVEMDDLETRRVVKPALERNLNERIGELNRQLLQHGVDVQR